MRDFIECASDKVAEHFRARQSYLELWQCIGTTAEEWFRVELLSVFDSLQGVTIEATNQRVGTDKERPDFSLQIQGRPLRIELKVLPQNAHYQSGWGRFQAVPNNNKDFMNLVSGERQGIIYVHWPSPKDWRQCRKRILEKYAVECVREDSLPCCAAHSVVISYWQKRKLVPK